jgi:hypothetical protein
MRGATTRTFPGGDTKHAALGVLLDKNGQDAVGAPCCSALVGELHRGTYKWARSLSVIDVVCFLGHIALKWEWDAGCQ